MLTYKAMYKFLDHGVHGQVLDFSGVITWGENMAAACCAKAANIRFG
jgi:hypothetical protein